MSGSRAAIVTGSDSDVGRATAVALARDGFDVGITWHADELGAHGTAAEVEGLGRRAVVRRIDPSDPDRSVGVVEEMSEDLGRLDVLVNDAGSGVGMPVLAQTAARRLVHQGEGGRIVNVTSVRERVPLADSPAHGSTQSGLALLTRVMALELADHEITVNAVAPGRRGDAHEVAAAIVFLAGPQAYYVTGASLVVDGGVLLMPAQANRLVS